MVHCQESSLANRILDFWELGLIAAWLRYQAASLGSAVCNTLRATVKEACIYEKFHSRHTVLAKEIVGLLTTIVMVHSSETMIGIRF
jgi:hypothetical protein